MGLNLNNVYQQNLDAYTELILNYHQEVPRNAEAAWLVLITAPKVCPSKGLIALALTTKHVIILSLKSQTWMSWWVERIACRWKYLQSLCCWIIFIISRYSWWVCTLLTSNRATWSGFCITWLRLYRSHCMQFLLSWNILDRQRYHYSSY